MSPDELEGGLGGLYKKLMDRILRGAIHRGQFQVIWPDGAQSTYGDGQGPLVTVEISDAAWLRRLVANPALAVGEAYMDEGLKPVGCTMHELLVLLMENIRGQHVPVLAWNARIRRLLRPFMQANGTTRAP